MMEARNVNGSAIFKQDPTEKNYENYNKKIKEPMCLDWIDENICYTEECIKAPYLETMSAKNLLSSDLIKNKNAISKERGNGKPNKRQYKTFKSFKEDINKIYTNSVKYNGNISHYTTLALTIVEAVNGKERKYKDVIDRLTNEVNATYMTFDLQPIMNQLINGLLNAPTLAPFNSLDKYQHLNIFSLWEIRQKVHDKHYQTFGHFVNDLKHLQQFCYEQSQENTEFITSLKILPVQFENKLKPFKQALKKIDSDSVNHFKLKKKPPFV